MVSWKIRRTVQAVFTVWAVVTISFALIRLMPGNPLGAMVADLEERGLDPVAIQKIIEVRVNMQPDAPLHVAYWNYMTSTLQGDLGQSLVYARPVGEVLADGIPFTIFVASWATFISFFVGISFGALMAYREGGKLDIGLTTYAVLIGSTPFYVLALLLLIFMGYRWGIFPTGGRQPTGVDPAFTIEYTAGVAYHATLPVLSLLVASGIASLGMRGNSIRVLGEDYLRVARLRGLSDLTISTQYVTRNAVLPMYTGLLISIGAMIGGSTVLEQIFQYRGLGLLMLEGVQQRDLPLMMGGFMVITIAVVAALLVADLTYSLVDPRAGGQSDAF